MGSSPWVSELRSSLHNAIYRVNFQLEPHPLKAADLHNGGCGEFVPQCPQQYAATIGVDRRGAAGRWIVGNYMVVGNYSEDSSSGTGMQLWLSSPAVMLFMKSASSALAKAAAPAGRATHSRSTEGTV